MIWLLGIAALVLPVSMAIVAFPIIHGWAKRDRVPTGAIVASGLIIAALLGLEAAAMLALMASPDGLL